ncbi:MAG: acetyl-CoA carboxylase biotin carboxylase subunit, partial [Proteobacteria bacterium]|nr:acetyl-CoA carboxylase biotin carboxylase subunit [Pseudomonadota bacterium]
LIAEIIVKDTSRKRVINKMRMALNETIIEGVKTNVDLHKRIIEDTNFHEYKHFIKYLEEDLLKNE